MIGDMPLLCRTAIRRVLSTYMPRWEDAVVRGRETLEEGAVTWTSGRYGITALGDSLRLTQTGDDGDDGVTVVLPPSGDGSLDRAGAIAIVRALRVAVRTAMDPHCREAERLLKGLMDIAYDAAAAHMGSGDRVQLNVGVGRPDAVRISSDAGPDRGVLRDVSPAWSERLAGSPHRHALADDPGGGAGSAGQVVIIQGARITALMSDLPPLEVMRRLAALPENLRSPQP